MKDYTKLLKQKDISPLAKLIIIDIAEFVSLMTYNKTSQEIANDLGCKKKNALQALDELQELGLITCKIEYRSRKTKLTNIAKQLITND